MLLFLLLLDFLFLLLIHFFFFFSSFTFSKNRFCLQDFLLIFFINFCFFWGSLLFLLFFNWTFWYFDFRWMFWSKITKEFFSFHNRLALHIMIINLLNIWSISFLIFLDNFFRGFLLLNILCCFLIPKESKEISSICWNGFFWNFRHEIEMKSFRKYCAFLKALVWYFFYNIFLYQQRFE